MINNDIVSGASVIAVTGPMASGKNYICTQLEQQGWCSIDADILVHKAIELVKDKILQKFIPYAEQQNIKLTNDDGTINRRALGQLLFSFPELLQVQESIVYPIIIEQIQDFINQHEKSIINATVLYKTPQLLVLCDKVLYVKAPFFTRLTRARRRDKLPFSQIFKRFKAQKNLLKEYQKLVPQNKLIIVKNK
ncbi:MAG: dephospho-CoA kinase [Treponema sp.]|nr:dephospho-CoA kinase [Treponema sp.]